MSQFELVASDYVDERDSQAVELFFRRRDMANALREQSINVVIRPASSDSVPSGTHLVALGDADVFIVYSQVRDHRSCRFVRELSRLHTSVGSLTGTEHSRFVDVLEAPVSLRQHAYEFFGKTTLRAPRTPPGYDFMNVNVRSVPGQRVQITCGGHMVDNCLVPTVICELAARDVTGLVLCGRQVRAEDIDGYCFATAITGDPLLRFLERQVQMLLYSIDPATGNTPLLCETSSETAMDPSQDHGLFELACRIHSDYRLQQPGADANTGQFVVSGGQAFFRAENKWFDETLGCYFVPAGVIGEPYCGVDSNLLVVAEHRPPRKSHTQGYVPRSLEELLASGK